ncbi:MULTISPECIES: AEC family transporter [Paenibacillus]|uniref:AEC family transporter n=1 Tax=Paenibacillus oceani TaxID=2772510 RepID=A0A927C834_9BACL|nr:AEC family transporter [Paenibacillus oceani]MBD2861471.1 AEC family transporter [Paenibacillus oceani]MDF2659522.1 Auxin Efflux Carrier [Paenibacillus sp.]
MSYFVYILLNNVVPLSLLIALGVILQKSFQLDIKTLSKLNFYLFSPAIMFQMLYESQLSFKVMSQVLLFFFVFFFASFGLVEIVMRIRGYKGGMRSAMRNSVIFYNSANYAIPLNQLVFVGDPFTLSIQIIIMMMQSLIPNTYGVYAVNAHRQKLKDTLKTILSMPVIYVIPIALIMRGFHIPVPQPLYISIDYIAKGFIATALTTLGVQLGSMKWQLKLKDVAISNFLRLCAGPLLGFLIVWAFGFEGDMAKALILSCAVPTSLSSVLLAVEFDNEPEFSSQAVFSSTVFSIFTVTFVIYLLQFVG